MKIGKILFEHGIFLAPMAGVTDIPFRKMCKKYGAEGVYTEMVSSRALCFKDEKTAELAKIMEYEHPCFLQIFGNDPETMAKASVLALRFSPDIIDINMGCPAPKISGNGDGCAIMKSPVLAHDIVKAVITEMEKFGIPVTVKIRSGFSKDCKNAVEVAKACEDAGAAAVAVHARTKEQMYSPPVELDIIKRVKENVSIPVIGNGDIVCADDALKMINETGCDGVMVGRGALGNPYIFKEILCAFEKKDYVPVSNLNKLNDICTHIRDLVSLKGEYTGVREARKHVAWYLKGMPGAAKYRDEVNKAQTLDSVLDICNRAFLL